MSKIKPFWRIVIGLWMLTNCLYYSSTIAERNNWIGFCFWGAVFATYVYFAIKIKYDDPVRSMRDILQAQTEEKGSRENQRLKELEQKRETEAAERAEWEAKHGRITTALAGVTFDNDDGTSRQKLLKDLKARGGDADLNLQEFEYKGQPAVQVLVDGECIGNIPKTRVQEVLDVFDRIENASLNVECFHPDDYDFEDEAGSKRRKRETIYRADLTIVYSKIQQE